jgi:hypothetical protein
VLDLLGVATGDRLEGLSLLPLIEGRELQPAGAPLLPPAMAYSEGILHGPPKASVTSWPWKLILDIDSGREAFFDLASDPGEHADLAGRPPDAYRSLAAALHAAQLGASDTWYLEIAGGAAGHTFDVEISAQDPAAAGTIYLARLLDSSGGLLENQPATGTAAGGLRLGGLQAADPVVLTFKAEGPPGLPLTFDFKLDGRRAAARTFIGGALKQAGQMPFTRRTGQMASKGLSAPRQRPDPPYFLLWRVPGRSAGQKAAALSADTRQELRALGYIQ